MSRKPALWHHWGGNKYGALLTVQWGQGGAWSQRLGWPGDQASEIPEDETMAMLVSCFRFSCHFTP